MTLDMLPWVISRATGFTAYLLLAGAMLAGLLVRTREGVGPLKGADAVALHRLFSLTALGLTAIHGTALLFDSTIDVAPWGLVVPGLIPYRPEWTGAGVLAAEAMALVHVSFSLRKKIGSKAWRRIHWLAYLVFAGATAHGLASGTDSGRTWALALYAGATTAVAALTGWRAVTARKTRRTAKPAPVRHHRDVSEAPA
jgi:DMSO/TMAO reductase YedYZ heme-binding membrane subunit